MFSFRLVCDHVCEGQTEGVYLCFIQTRCIARKLKPYICLGPERKESGFHDCGVSSTVDVVHTGDKFHGKGSVATASTPLECFSA